MKDFRCLESQSGMGLIDVNTKRCTSVGLSHRNESCYGASQNDGLHTLPDCPFCRTSGFCTRVSFNGLVDNNNQPRNLQAQ
jgi:hypothetical protein